MAIDSRAVGGAIVKKSIVIDTSQNWTAPLNLAGNQVWITGCGGGGGGARGFSSAGFSNGGFGGAYCIKTPVQVTAGAVYAVVIGAGGGTAGAGIGNGSVGGDTTFGSLLTIKGGDGGPNDTLNLPSAFLRVGVKPHLVDSATVVSIGDTVNGNIAGVVSMDNTSSTPTVVCTGGGAGLFGNGGAGNHVGNAGNGPANSGAGGGSSRDTFGTAGNGGSGRLIIEWEEFL